uniref:Uncharacterized protein n=1 Tax=Ixodes ricinus TaxID=34613 RepID=A0A6B0UCK2_IXORI
MAAGGPLAVQCPLLLLSHTGLVSPPRRPLPSGGGGRPGGPPRGQPRGTFFPQGCSSWDPGQRAPPLPRRCRRFVVCFVVVCVFVFVKA